MAIRVNKPAERGPCPYKAITYFPLLPQTQLQQHHRQRA